MELNALTQATCSHALLVENIVLTSCIYVYSAIHFNYTEQRKEKMYHTLIFRLSYCTCQIPKFKVKTIEVGMDMTLATHHSVYKSVLCEKLMSVTKQQEGVSTI